MGVLTHFSNLLLAVYRQAQELPVQDFQDRVLSTLKHHLVFDSSIWGTATMTDRGIDIHTLHLHNTTRQMMEAYEKIKHLDVAAAMVTAQPVATLAFNAETDFPQRELKEFRSFLHEYRHENYFLTSSINPLTRFAHWISLYRADKAQVCTATEIELLACLAPHLMQALAINRLVHLDRLIGDFVRQKWSVAIADTRGVLYHLDQRFRNLVALEWRLHEASLPQALLKQLVERNGELTGRHVVVRLSSEGSLLFLRARKREAVDSLTEREFLVARLAAAGHTHKQIAVQLGRSPATIRNQISAVFDKLGVNNVAMLPALVAVRE